MPEHPSSSPLTAVNVAGDVAPDGLEQSLAVVGLVGKVAGPVQPHGRGGSGGGQVRLPQAAAAGRRIGRGHPQRRFLVDADVVRVVVEEDEAPAAPDVTGMVNDRQQDRVDT